MKKTLLLIVFVLSLYNAKAQCPDTSHATLTETQEWLKLMIEKYGNRNSLATTYKVMFDTCRMTIYQMAVLNKSGKVDTVYKVSFLLGDMFEIGSWEATDTNPYRFKYNLMAKNLKVEKGSKYKSLSGEVVKIVHKAEREVKDIDFKDRFEIYFTPQDEPNLTKRLGNAFTHAKCLCGTTTTTPTPADSIKSKF